MLEIIAVKAPSLESLTIHARNTAFTWVADDCFIHLKKFKKLKALTFPLLDLVKLFVKIIRSITRRVDYVLLLIQIFYIFRITQ